ncbi:MAG: permease [Flavobacteriales bacterium CG_4_9_14_0_2_um_filter_35_242]|nr:YjgP/YjgQ family permease [Zetaproteobacteria bacterium]NDK18828.1 YjgP/YjgQ family permease [Flavobacteriales bacterium]OIO11804.1 MAG: permease [Flavobacteriaceae bacterium CG1_02_35_72]PIR14129.1 MAG: permease [Flavobacteriales bacterium CG11_big_fil_rev_8_21_14_0_20_35_7]PIV16914.1 MAG: permease [Flavobacteriales bacterium CG03_land_8_20_14_0_80_35_15]PJA05765.1 MAG: permease [Flavobacteriales bacterium CG_4_10_14_0_2_um_filter_35_18]PJC58655.1 MAG: permease [Flavobacteriales bacterium
MKIIDKYIITSFLKPFLTTFLVILFVLVMQTLWLRFDQIAGKGIDIIIIFKFLSYLSLMMVPQAFPIAILLSSIMAIGRLAESYELAALKSAGISLKRIIRPLIFVTIIFSGINFLFLNNVFPKAAFKSKNLLVNMQKKKPALSLIEGRFNADIPGYLIRFDEKYGKEKNLLKNVLIYDLTDLEGNVKSITAKTGKITTEEGSKYMTFVLNNGFFNEESDKKINSNIKKRMPYMRSFFEEYTVNIDISKLDDVDLEEERYKKDFEMLGLSQLSYYIDSLKVPYDEFITNKSNDLYLRTNGKNLHPQTIKQNYISDTILNNFKTIDQYSIIISAQELAKRNQENIDAFESQFLYKQYIINVFDIEYHKRIAFSVACLVLFFIGAPLGAIIRKGGFGLPMIIAILIFVVYYFISILGSNMARVSSIPAYLGAWLATIIMLPFGIYLTRKATAEIGLFNIDAFLQPINNFFNRFKKINK